ncbi:ScbA/BarX family gamma-butyrolactone biosynthesis protein [Streptomyces sp. B1I3]|uniref:ScbA/BarX family gamma-butyrolactone biosynthesis protein n=1 Tax=Streptomyces sp. B1I3 TaxID=3042264 RepID=UPI0027D8DC19|nr:ScbA/BarX family gamma-butyrolactone biosynthesis protein [Streptomyces sp. B1I3]
MPQPTALVTSERTTVPMELVHRRRTQDVVPTDWTHISGDRFLVRGTWPDNHRFFAPRNGLYDPLLLVESMRQSTILIGHGAYDVPADHHFLMWGLDFTTDPGHLAVRYGPEVELEVELSGITRSSGRLSGMHSHVTVRLGRHTAGTGISRIKVLSAKTYARIRGDLPVAPPAASPAVLAPPPRVGRTRPEDVLLVPTGRAGRWQLRVDTSHPTLYQGPKDHIPGMVLIEAARQAAHAVSGPAAFLPSRGGNAFHRYAEFRSPLWIEAVRQPDGHTVHVTGRQDGRAVFTSSVTVGGAGEIR